MANPSERVGEQEVIFSNPLVETEKANLKWKLITAIAILAITLLIGILGSTGTISGIGADGSIAILCVSSILLLLAVIVRCCALGRLAASRVHGKEHAAMVHRKPTVVADDSQLIQTYQIELNRMIEKSVRIIKLSDHEFFVLVRFPIPKVAGADIPQFEVTAHATRDAADAYAAQLIDSGYFDVGGFSPTLLKDSSRTNPQLVQAKANLLTQLQPGTYQVHGYWLFIAHNTPNQQNTLAGKYEVFEFYRPSHEWGHIAAHLTGKPLNYTQA